MKKLFLFLPILIFSVILAFVPVRTFAAYDPGLIISDAELTAKDSMSEADIQAWLAKKNSSLATMTVPAARTVTYYIGGHNPDGSDRTLTTYENTVVGPYGVGIGFEENVAGLPISTLIHKVAHWYGINPQVILTIIQKESIYITRTDGAAMAIPGHDSYATYAWLMGYAYTEDTANPAKMACGVATPGANPTKSCAGIAAQIDNAAWALTNWMRLANNHDAGNKFTCSTWSDYYWTNDAFRLCDDEWVAARSGATAALYRYTPHTGLTGGYTGNKAFYSIFTNWFPPLPLWTNAPQLKYMSGNGFWDTNKSSFSAVGDFNGDGKEDTAAMYDYGDGKIGIWSFESNSSSVSPRLLYMGQKGYWNVGSTVALIKGDFNGDKRDDLGAVYNYDKGKIGIWSFESNGTSMSPRLLYLGKEGYWDITTASSKYFAGGDFNGDGKGDIAAMYDYGSDKMSLWSFESDGATMNPKVLYLGQTGNWNFASTKYLLAGDFNGDKKDDIGAVYDYGNGRMGIWTFSSNGSTASPVLAFMSAVNVNFWDFTKSAFFTTGDFNGDGKSDIASTYDYGEGEMSMWIFQADNGYLLPRIMSDSSKDCWFMVNTRWLIGADLNGDKKDELAAMYDYGNYRVGIWSFGY